MARQSDTGEHNEAHSEASLSQAPEGRENYNFVQLSRSYLVAMRKLTRKSPIAHEILYYLIEHMGRTTNAVVCSRAVLAEVTGTTTRTVSRAIALLKADNWIDTVKIGNASAYCVNERAFWQAARNQRHYAVFSATVIAAGSEQETGFREKAKHKLRHIPIIDENDIPVINTAEQLPPPDQQDLDL